NGKPFVWILDDEWEQHDLELKRYEEAGYEVKVTRSHELEHDLFKYAAIADGVVAQVGFPCGKEIINALENCKVIAISGVGFNHVDLEAATERGIYVSNVPDYCMDEVSDHTIAMLLYWMRRLSRFQSEVQKDRSWDPLCISDIHRISDVTVGLLGLGRIARKVAEKLQVFGARVIAHDAYVDDAVFRKYNVESVSLDKLLNESQFLSLHVPLTPDTENILDEVNLKKLPKNAFIVNTCRGGIINEKDLENAIKSGHIAGAALDVLAQEPPNFDHPLIHMEKVLITPHSAYNSIESLQTLRHRSCDIVIEGIENGKLIHSINRETIKLL